MYLTLDIGNTRTKLAAFDQEGNLVRSKAIAPTAADTPPDVRQVAQAVALMEQELQAEWQAVAWCSTGRVPEGLPGWLESIAPCVLRVTGLTPTPLRMDYATPHTLGADRLAAAVGAASLQPGVHLLVIDIGTCITYDIVSHGRTYVGGNISPGMQLRLLALHEHTAALPLVAPEGDCPSIGHDTATAIRAGVVHGMEAEILGTIHRLRQQYPGLQIWTTGGDTPGLACTDGMPLHSDPCLVARGLYHILCHHRKNPIQASTPYNPTIITT